MWVMGFIPQILVSLLLAAWFSNPSLRLKRMGADIQPTDDGMIIHGGKPLHGAEINSYLDHRIAMSFAVAGTICDGTLTIKDGDCVKISYPEFYEDLYSLGK